MTEPSKPLKNRPLESARILVCEGSDEFDLFTLLRNERGLGESDLEIVDANGRQNLVKTVDDQFYRSGGSAIRLMGVVLDSEDDLQDTQRLVEDIRMQVGIRARWLHCQLPDVNKQGALETLIRQSVPAQSPGAAYSRIGYAIKVNQALRQELDAALQPLKTILDQVLNAPLE